MPIVALALLALLPPSDDPPAASPFTSDLLSEITWRSLGPINMGGRITDLAVDPRRPSTYYVAAASGGVWKTTNNGATFTPIFDDAPTASIGDVTVAPSDPTIVWIGTGEGNPRNSVIPGCGVFKSIDAGATFTCMGLADSRQIGRIAIHPTNPDLVFVAAAGHTWAPNEERGLLRTRDGGKTWEKALFVDGQTGCIDVAIDPKEPSFVYAATWQRQRDEFDEGDPATQFGAGSGLWRSTDGGATFTRCTEGLPTIPMGRIGLELYASQPSTLFAIVQTELTGKTAPGQEPGERGPAWLGVRGDGGGEGFRVTEAIVAGPAEAAGIVKGDLILRVGDAAIRSWDEMTVALDQHQAGEECLVVLRRDGEEKTVQVKFGRRPGPQGDFEGELGGQNPNVQGIQGPKGFETGGLFRSDDHGATWRRINSLNPRPFYFSQVRVDPLDVNRIWVAGIALYRSHDAGATFDAMGAVTVHSDHHAMWIDPRDGDHLLLGTDGGLYETFDRGATWVMNEQLPIGQFYNVAVGLDRPYSVMGGLQDNGTWVGPSATRRRAGISADSWQFTNGGDGFHGAFDPDDASIVYAESQNGVLARLDLRNGDRADIRPPGGRFNWNMPFVLSPHNGRTVWAASERLSKSIDRGDQWTVVSPEITRTERGSATAVAESPLRPGVVAVGSDDGALWLSPDGGTTWTSLIERIPGLPGPRYVAEILFSRHQRDTLWVVFDGRRSDDLTPWLFRSSDLGATFTRVGAGLPEQALHALAESPRRAGLLFAGNTTGCCFSVDGGDLFTPLRGNLPTVPIFDLVVHPRERDLVAGTHGRGIWIVDITALEQMRPELFDQPLKLFDPRPVTLMSFTPGASFFSSPTFFGENPAEGVELWYWVREEKSPTVGITVRNVAGAVVARLAGAGTRGLHRAHWNLIADLDVPGAPVLRDGRLVAGDYLVTLTVDEQSSSATLRVEADPLDTPPAARPNPGRQE